MTYKIHSPLGLGILYVIMPLCPCLNHYLQLYNDDIGSLDKGRPFQSLSRVSLGFDLMSDDEKL